MTLNKRKQYEDTMNRIEVAERILDNIQYLPGGYLLDKFDCDTTDMGWSEREDHRVRNDDGMAVYEFHEEDGSSWTTERNHLGALQLEANKLVYDTLIKWIDSKK